MLFRGSFPPGYRFRPTDEELVNSYLWKKVMKLPLPCDNKIMGANIYKFHPQQLQQNYCKEEGDEFMYFFSSRDRKYPQGNRPNRSAGDGFWKATGVDRAIKQKDNGRIIGTRKTLVYYEGKAKDVPVKTNWIMHEYRTKEQGESSRKAGKRPYNNITSPSSNMMMLDEYVLCKIYERTKKKSEEEEEDDDTVSNNDYSTSSEPLMQSDNGGKYASGNLGSASIAPYHHNFDDFTNFGSPLQGNCQGSALYDNVGYSSFMSPMQTTHNASSVIPMQTTVHKINVCSSSSVLPMRRTDNINVGSSSSVIPMQTNVDSISSVIPMQTTGNMHVGSNGSVTPMRISHDNVASTSFAAQLQTTHEYPAPDFILRPINHQMFAMQGNHDYFSEPWAQRTVESNAPGSVDSTSSMPAMQGNKEPTPRYAPDNSAIETPMPRMDDSNMQDHNGCSNDEEFDYLSFLGIDDEPWS